MSNEVIELQEGKDYEIVGESILGGNCNDTSLEVLGNKPSSGITDKRHKKEKKKKPLTIFSSLSYMLAKVSEDKGEIFRYLEAFLQNRPQTKENISLAYAYTLFSEMNPHERAYTTYEDLIEQVKVHSSGRHVIDPAFFFSAIAGGAHICNVQIAHTLATVRAPEVVEAMIREATKEEGSSFSDRKLLMEVTGIVDKENKGVTVNNNITSQVGIAIENKETGIPQFIGEIMSKDSLLREHYRKALKAKDED